MRCPRELVRGEGACCSRRNDRRVVDMKYDLEKDLGGMLIFNRTLMLFEGD